MIGLVKCQISLITKKLGYKVSLAIMLLVVITNYIGNIREYFGINLADMVAFLNLSIMSEEKSISWFITQSYPFLVVIPAGFSLATDKATKTDLLWISRCGKIKYHISKIIAVFIVTFICFTLPLCVELLLNVVAFPVDARGNLQGAALYSNEYNQAVSTFYLFEMYYKNPICYAIILIVFLGIISGMLAVITVAISTMYYKYKAYLILPVYLILYGMGLISGIFEQFPFETSYSYYIRWCTNQVHKLDFVWFGALIMILFVIALGAIGNSARKDTL